MHVQSYSRHDELELKLVECKHVAQNQVRLGHTSSNQVAKVPTLTWNPPTAKTHSSAHHPLHIKSQPLP